MTIYNGHLKTGKIVNHLNKTNMKITKKIKSKLLTYLFNDWVKTEEDVETLYLTKMMIENRTNKICPPKQVIGFRANR